MMMASSSESPFAGFVEGAAIFRLAIPPIAAWAFPQGGRGPQLPRDLSILTLSSIPPATRRPRRVASFIALHFAAAT